MMLSIEDLEGSKDKTITYRVEEEIDGINAKGPIKADLTFKSLGDFVEVQGKIKGTVLLECDLCLKEFTKEFDFKVEEYYTKYGLNPNNSDEFEIKQNSFIEELNGKDEIDLADFVYQSVILHIPNKLVCDINCNGSEIVNKYIKTDFTDPRLEVFKNIKLEKE